MTTPAHVLALDAGQSGIRAVLRSPAGAAVRHDLPGVINDGTATEQLAQAAGRLIAMSPTRVQQVAIGASGITDDCNPEQLLKALHPVGVCRVLIAHDSTTSYLGALGDRPGAVVAAGTGAVTLAIGPSSAARVDGWGYLIGNAGAGSWIGREAMRAVMRAHDGRGRPTGLTERMLMIYPDLERAYLELAADPERAKHFGAFAIDVAELADTDSVANEISVAAGRELAWSAATALRRVGLEGRSAPVACLGNVFKSTVVRESFDEALCEFAPAATLESARGTSLEGAGLLATVDTSSVLGRRIAVASYAT